MLSFDLAELYDVEPRVLVQAVKRNIDRFPEDFMFQLNKAEFENLKSQIVISSWGGRRSLPYAFSEQGIAMLSSILRSKKAIQINIEIMRTFVRLREIVNSNEQLAKKLSEIENKFGQLIGFILDELAEMKRQNALPEMKRKPIGFIQTY